MDAGGSLGSRLKAFSPLWGSSQVASFTAPDHAGEADQRWLDEACNDCGARVRPPVVAFNSGLLSAREYATELAAATCPTLVLSGQADKRVTGRRPYATEMQRCELQSLPGANVLPWEAAHESCAAIAEFAVHVQASAADNERTQMTD